MTAIRSSSRYWRPNRLVVVNSRLARCALIDWMRRPRPPVSTQLRTAATPAVMRGGSPSSAGSSGSTCRIERNVCSSPNRARRGGAPAGATAIALLVVPKSSPSNPGPLSRAAYPWAQLPLGAQTAPSVVVPVCGPWQAAWKSYSAPVSLTVASSQAPFRWQQTCRGAIGCSLHDPSAAQTPPVTMLVKPGSAPPQYCRMRLINEKPGASTHWLAATQQLGMSRKQLGVQNGLPSQDSPGSTMPLPHTGAAGGHAPWRCASFTRNVLASFFFTTASGSGGSRT